MSAPSVYARSRRRATLVTSRLLVGLVFTRSRPVPGDAVAHRPNSLNIRGKRMAKKLTKAAQKLLDEAGCSEIADD